jgi:hypothetical protein
MAISGRNPTRRRVLLAAGGTLAIPAIHTRAATSGVALVIGNSKYRWEASLPNVRRDAPDMAKRFQAMGLKTELLQDSGRQAMQQAIERFKSSARGADLAAFYFAGHGAAWGTDTYLVPQDADLANPNDVQKTLISASAVRASIDDARHRLLVFDNCRNNPADGWRQLEAERTAGFVPETQRESEGVPPDTLILYSTAPGRVAMDGPAGENSPFAAALLRQLSAPSVDLQSLEAKLRRDLLMATEGRQILWSQNTYQQPFAVAGGGGGVPAATGWANPNRVIDLPNAYAYARQNGLPLPLGLIAHRPAKTSPHFQKAASFKWDAHNKTGVSAFLLVTLSIEDSGRAELLLATHNDAGSLWRCTTATAAGSRLDFEANYGRPHFILDWRDANSGSVSAMRTERPGPSANPFSSAKFTRLDG